MSLFSVYWLSNSVLGLFVVHEFYEHMSANYADLTQFVIVFAGKWLAAIPLTFLVISIITASQINKCFGGQKMEVWSLLVGLLAPVYFGCIILLQTYSSIYAIWFFIQLNQDTPKAVINSNTTTTPIGSMGS